MRDYRQTNVQIASDLDTFFDNDPDVFDVIIFKAQSDEQETVTDVEDVVGSMESDRRTIEYADPIASKAKIMPFDFRLFATSDGEDANEGSAENPIIMLIKEKDIPKQSVIQYDEYINETDIRTVTLYLVHSEAYGQAPVITMAHYLIPMGDSDAFE